MRAYELPGRRKMAGSSVIPYRTFPSAEAPMPKRRFRFRILSRNAFKRLAMLFIFIAVCLFWCHCTMIKMPGTSFRGPLPPLSDSQAALADHLRRDVDMLAG